MSLLRVVALVAAAFLSDEIIRVAKSEQGRNRGRAPPSVDCRNPLVALATGCGRMARRMPGQQAIGKSSRRAAAEGGELIHDEKWRLR